MYVYYEYVRDEHVNKYICKIESVTIVKSSTGFYYMKQFNSIETNVFLKKIIIIVWNVNTRAHTQGTKQIDSRTIQIPSKGPHYSHKNRFKILYIFNCNLNDLYVSVFFSFSFSFISFCVAHSID